jgi:putative ABC transport system permease protein
MRSLFGLVCLTYPREFRQRYFAQIVGDFEQHERECAGGAGYVLRMLCDVIASGLSLRLEMVARDVSTALRRLRQSPLLVVIMVLTFALGIGANLTVFSVLNSVLLQPLPFANADRLVAMRMSNPRNGVVYPDAFSLPDLWDVRTRTKTLQNATGFHHVSMTLTGYGKPVALRGLAVTWRFFETLGVHPEMGQFPTQPASLHALDAKVVISDALWRGRFHAARDIIGKTITLDGTASQVIGVAAARFQSPEPFDAGLESTEVWSFMPEIVSPKLRGWRYLYAVALVRPGVSIEAVRADVNRVQQQLSAEYPRYDKGDEILVDPLRSAIFGNGASAILWIVFGAVLGVFLIMCANVASLLLTQTNTRTHELTMRMALGASRARIMKQLLTESGVLAVLGGILGIGIAYLALHEFVVLAQGELPRLSGASIDLRVLLYGTGIVIAAALLAGTAPAWILASSPALATVRTASRSGLNANRRLQSSLVVLEIALALALVTASGLTLRSFYALTHANMGVRSAGVLASDAFNFPAKRFPTLGSKVVVLDRLRAQLGRIPGSTYALAVSHPMGDQGMSSGVKIGGRNFPPGNGPFAEYNAVSPAYFSVLGIELRRGRIFTQSDSTDSQPVAIVNQSFSKYFPPGTPLIGKRIRVTLGNILHPNAWMTIVGVVTDTRDDPTQAAQPVVYIPLSQTNNDWIMAVVYAPHSATNIVRKAIGSAFANADPLSQSPGVFTIPELMVNSASGTRLSAALFTALGIIALALAIAGIFGVVSYSVSQRIAEFGIRMAIGSTQAAIVRNVLEGVAVLLAFGVAIGLVLAALAGRTLGPNLYGVKGDDAATLLVVTAILASTALIAGALPALRAARLDPATALRYE